MKPRLPAKHGKSVASHNRGAVVALAILAVMGMISVVFPTTPSKGSLKGTHSSNDANMATPPPGVERRNINNIDVLLQRPPVAPPKGILFVAHGCSHSNTDWWPSTDICPECIGLPEEQAIVNLAAKEYQFMIVAISSINRKSKCWSGMDGPRVAEVLKELLAEENVPIIAFGASSGGSFVGNVLPKSMQEAGLPLAGFISQIAAPPPPEVQNIPVAVYITMNRDPFTDDNAQENVKQLKSQNRPAKQIRLDPLAMEASFFHDRISGYPMEESKALIDALEKAQYIDPQTKYLAQDPRRSNWRAVLRPLVTEEQDSFVADASPISEVLNVAHAQHELSRDGVREAIDFILQEASS